jgi:hypothetical protein
MMLMLHLVPVRVFVSQFVTGSGTFLFKSEGLIFSVTTQDLSEFGESGQKERCLAIQALLQAQQPQVDQGVGAVRGKKEQTDGPTEGRRGIDRLVGQIYDGLFICLFVCLFDGCIGW